MDEFDIIRQHFAPLASSVAGSFRLTDDAAAIEVPEGKELIVTTDVISQGIHFLGSESPSLIARKLLRVNLSDLAAMGATPYVYFLSLMLPKSTDAGWVRDFAAGFSEDQERFGIHLAGGDTTATQGSLALSITAIGLADKGTALRRNDAKANDDIYVSGTLGDSALGLGLLQNAIKPGAGFGQEHKVFLEQRYYLPEPRVALGQKLHGIAHAAMDISDGLMQDLSHICNASDGGATVYRRDLPLSGAARALITADENLWDLVIGGGDDYELLFTAAPDKTEAIASLSKELNLPLTKIGRITEVKGVTVLDEKGIPLAIKHKGFKHF